jgi:DNA-binding PadR family transcriptional regulator
MEILILSSLARAPMHGYELKLELRYKHVKFWAKAEHGHLYAALQRLRRRGDIFHVSHYGGRRDKKVYKISTSGLQRVQEALERLVAGPDETYFDVDLFLSGAYLVDRRKAVHLLHQRAARIDAQREEAEILQRQMAPYVPTVARLIMDHRIQHLRREAEFTRQAEEALRLEGSWGPFLGTRSITDFLADGKVHLEDDAAVGHSLTKSAAPRPSSRRRGRKA